MADVWLFLLLGLGTGASYVLAALGVVLIHRGSGVINFAQGAYALIGAYAADELHRLGAPLPVAVPVGVLLAGASGALTHVVVIRRLATASQLTRVIATLGVLTFVTAGLALRYGDYVSFPAKLVDAGGVSVLGAEISIYSLVMIGLAVSATLGLRALYRHTLFGLRTAAVAENPRMLAAQGHSPDLVATCNWAAGGALAGLAGCLLAPQIGLGVTPISLLLVPSLAAALLGRFTSFGVTCVGGFAMGIAESELTRFDLGPGWSNSFPFLVIILVLALRGRSLPGREDHGGRLPALGTGTVRPVVLLPAAAVLVVLVATLPVDAVSALTTSLAVGIVMISAVVVSGYAGQISLAQWGLAGVGGFLAARFAEWTGVNFAVAILLAVLAVLPVGALFGLPALRARGVTLAIVTLGLGFAVETILFGNPDYTGGQLGILLDEPVVAGLSLDGYLHPRRYALLAAGCLLLAALAATNLRRGRTGRRMIAVRGNERAAAALGVSVVGVKLYAFTLGAGLAALCGGLLVFRNSSAVFTGYTTVTSITLLTLLVMGGIGYIGGALVASFAAGGGLLVYLLDQVFQGPDVATWIAAVSGLGLVITVITAPDGVSRQVIEGAGGRLLRMVPARLRGDQAPPPAVGAADPPMPWKEAGATHTLSVQGLGVRFGGVTALDGVSLEVRSGEVLGLIGPNGAGKTTLIDAVSGMVRRYDGTVSLDGVPLDGASAAERARRGVVRSFQSLELFDDLTVLGNLQVASEPPSAWAYLTDLVRPGRSALSPAAELAVRTFDLGEDLHRMPAELSYGKRRLVGIARAVAACPDVVLLDEPAAGLDEAESAELALLLRELADRMGLAVLLIEHDVNLVMSVCDRVVALDFGRTIAHGTPADVRADAAVVTAYLGANHAGAPVAPVSEGSMQ